MTTQASFALLQGAREIRVSLVTDGPRIAGLVTEKHPPPVVDGQPMFDFDKQVQHLVHELETAEDRVIVAENDHMKQEVVVSRLRTERDQKVDKNHGKLVAARQGFDGLQGPKGSFETAFVSGAAPRRPKRLLGQLAQSVTLLKEPVVEPREARIAGFEVDYTAVADDLEGGRLDLQATVDRLDEESKRAEGTMLARRAAVADLRSTVIWAGRTAEGLFERAGEHELAKRIRTSTRRPLRPAEEAAAAEPADGETPAAGDSAGSEAAAEPAGASESQTSNS